MPEVSVTIAAPATLVWDHLLDVERWPNWTASMLEVRRLDPGVLAPGHRVRISQPRMPTLVWTVGEIRAEDHFVWAASSIGVTTLARHDISPVDERRTRLVLSVEHRGFLAPLVRLLTGRRTRRFIDMEAAGFKRAAEATAALGLRGAP
jgi:hypothetical protein